MELKLRNATANDGELLLSWRNDPSTYKYYFTPEPVDREVHFEWFRKSLETPTREIYIAERDGTPVGMVRIDLTAAGEKELSWAVAAQARGQGIGTALLKTIRSQVKGVLLAEIMIENAASTKMAELAGFTHEKTENGVVFYRNEE